MPVTWSDEKLILLYFPGRGLNSRPPARRSVNMIKVSYALTTRPRRHYKKCGTFSCFTLTFLEGLFAPNCTFCDQFCIHYLVRRCRYHCCSTQCAFSPNFCTQNVFVAEIYRDFSELFVFKRRQNAGFPAGCGTVDTYNMYMA